MTGGFQSAVSQVPAVGVAGDFCSANIPFTYDAGPGGLVAGPNGVTVGAFAWTTSPEDADGLPATVNSYGGGSIAGFVGRQGQPAVITAFLGDASMLIPAGYQMFLYVAGDFWVKNSGVTQAVPGQKAYANVASGLATFAATGTPSTGGSGSASSVAAGTSSVTAGIQGNIMTVSAVGSGTVYPGTTISGTGVTSGNSVVSQITPLLAGEALGGIGRYYVQYAEQNVAGGTTVSGTYGTLTIGGTVAGTIAVGDTISGSGVVAGTQITAPISGTGGAGTYVVNNNTVVSSTAITALGNVETKWIAMSSALPGELVKISSRPLG